MKAANVGGPVLLNVADAKIAELGPKSRFSTCGTFASGKSPNDVYDEHDLSCEEAKERQKAKFRKRVHFGLGTSYIRSERLHFVERINQNPD